MTRRVTLYLLGVRSDPMVGVIYEVASVVVLLIAVAGLAYVIGITGTPGNDDTDPRWSGILVTLLIAVFLAAMIGSLVM